MKYNDPMAMKSFEDTAYWKFLQISIRVRHDVAKLADMYDMSVMQLVTLCSLKPGEAIRMNMISSLLVCDASNVTGIVDRLVQRGFISREEGEDDRRVKVIQLTPKGARLRETLIREIDRTQPESISALTPKEFETLNILVKKALSSK